MTHLVVCKIEVITTFILEERNSVNRLLISCSHLCCIVFWITDAVAFETVSSTIMHKSMFSYPSSLSCYPCLPAIFYFLLWYRHRWFCTSLMTLVCHPRCSLLSFECTILIIFLLLPMFGTRPWDLKRNKNIRCSKWNTLQRSFWIKSVVRAPASFVPVGQCFPWYRSANNACIVSLLFGP